MLYFSTLPTAPGLQVLTKQGEWIDTPLLENTLVMNIGDMMEILSNGKYLATKHRVKKVQQERYSFPLFFSCDYDYVIQPINTNEPPKYAPLAGGEHLFNQTAQTFHYLKQRVASGELVLKNAVPLYSFGLTAVKHGVHPMNLFETLSQLKPITAASGNVPTYLMGAFRRKSI